MSLVETDDPDRAAEALGASFPGLDLIEESGGRPFRFLLAREQRGAITYSRMRVQGRVQATGVYPDEFSVARCSAGRVELSYGRQQIDTSRPYLRLRGRSRGLFTDSRTDLVSIDPHAFRTSVARRLDGTGMALTPPELAAIRPARIGARVWNAAADALASDDASSPLRTKVLEELVMSALLTAFPLTRQEHPPSGLDALPRALRRATEFVDEHLAEPISVVDIAEAARLSVRALQVGFRRHLGTTPVTYLTRARLSEAHADLRDGDPERDTVAEVARRWGFRNPGRFAAQYREAYGQSPSETLHR